MSFTIDQDLKERVRRAVDIVDLVGSSLDLRRQGRGFVARCPWHDDRRPSLQVNPDRQSWKCWVCDLGGDVFSFTMQREGITFPEALRMLAERAGIQIEPQPGTAGKPALSIDDKRLLYQAVSWACQQYRQNLIQSEEAAIARKYLADRGLSPETLEKFQIGYAPAAWDWLQQRAAAANVSPAQLETTGFLGRSERGTRYDRFRDRVMFPIRDPQGQTIATGGRILPGSTEAAKYINSPETRLYSKSNQLFGLDMARDFVTKSRKALVMEGYTDVMMAHQFGLQNAVAVCGTALGTGHIRLLRRFCDEVILVLDGDEAGQRRTNEVLELFVAAQMNLRILTLPRGLDPCDYLLEHGSQSLATLTEEAVDALEHKMRVTCRGFDPLVDTHLANKALEEILSTIALAPRTGMLGDDAQKLRQTQLLNRLSRHFHVAEEELRQRLKKLRDKPSVESARWIKAESPENTRPSVQYRFSDLSKIDTELFEILILQADLAPLALERIAPNQLGSDCARALLQLYEQLEMSGQSLEFASVLASAEDPSIKSVLVSLEEECFRKAKRAPIEAYHRLQALLDRLNEQVHELAQQEVIRTLEEAKLSDEETIDVLEDILRQTRLRQGLAGKPIGTNDTTN
ncbi:MAG: primase [Planctomycetota bacterium]